MKKYLYSIVLSLFILSSCEENLDLALKNQPSVMVLNALAGKDSLVKVNISRTYNLKDEPIDQILNGATVKLYEEEKLLGNLEAFNNGWYQLNTKFESEKEYEIVVSHPDYTAIHSKTNIPVSIPIVEVIFEKEHSNRQYYSIKFDDKEESQDYYMILLKGISLYENNGETYEYSTDLTYYSDDVVFNGNLLENATDLEQQYLLGSKTFSDFSFNGQHAAISFFVDKTSNWSDFTELKIMLYHINKDYYAYERSKKMIENRKNFPFYKKINLHSNVVSGSGIFAGYAVSSKNFKLP